MSKPSEHLDFQWAELNKLNDQLRLMRRWGVLPSDPGFKRLLGSRGAAMAKLGLNVPRTTTLILKLFGLSPGELTLFADAEIGWLVEAKATPAAPPVYRYVGDDIAEKVVRKTLTHDEFTELMTPDPYQGE